MSGMSVTPAEIESALTNSLTRQILRSWGVSQSFPCRASASWTDPMKHSLNLAIVSLHEGCSERRRCAEYVDKKGDQKYVSSWPPRCSMPDEQITALRFLKGAASTTDGTGLIPSNNLLSASPLITLGTASELCTLQSNFIDC